MPNQPIPDWLLYTNTQISFAGVLLSPKCSHYQSYKILCQNTTSWKDVMWTAFKKDKWNTNKNSTSML